jgi:DMSO/TMAO reductase YedYZ molybdopterin-dependent catalytic subunit
VPARPFLTSASDFQDVSRGNPNPQTLQGEALIKARLTPETWRLEITADDEVRDYVKEHASIAQPLTLDLAALQELGKTHGVKFIKAMQCLNIPGPLGQGLWEGVPLREILRLCGRMTNVRRIFYWGFHNDDPAQLFRSSLSYSQVMETPPGELPVFVAYKLNGESLPLGRGGPVRMIVPWAHGFKSIKWLQRIVLTNDYKANDTYAEKNNDPESHLKTAAYLDEMPKQFAAGEAVALSGLAISGWSGLRRVEYWVRPADSPPAPLADEDPAWESAKWQECAMAAAPRDWTNVLPVGVAAREVLGFDPASGQPLAWPLRYSMVAWSAAIRGLAPGQYEVRARAVDLNGFAQPEPRPMQKAGKNGIQVRRFQVV